MDSFDLKTHIFDKSTEIIDKFCRPLFQSSNAKLFRYIRLYNDGSRIVLNSHPEILDYFYKESNYVNTWYENGTPPLSEPGWHTWATLSSFDTLVQENMKLELKKRLGVCHDVHFLKFYPDSYEVFAFASNSPDIYLEGKDLFNQFVFYFKNNHHKLLKNSFYDRVTIPLPKDNVFTTKKINPSQNNINFLPHIKKVFLDTEKQLYLTESEFKIIRLYIEGKNAKEIAALLLISNRTVEHHLNNIKQKLNCTKISKVINILQNYGVL